MSSAKIPGRSLAPSNQVLRPRHAASPFRMALGVAVLIFAVFVAYAFLTRATYRATALIAVEPLGSSAPLLPAPLEAARKLHEAVLGRELLSKLAAELSPSGSAEARVAEASRVRDALQIDTIDSRVYSVSFKDSDPARTQRITNVLARQAVERAGRALSGTRPEEERQQEGERDRRASEVVAFLAAHPEVALQAQAAPTGAPPKEDPALFALRAERARLAQRLERLKSTSDNPYADPADMSLTREQIERRLTEIDAVVASRRRAIEHPTTHPPVPRDVEDKWRNLLQGLAEVPAAAASAPAESFRARLLEEAPLPTSPIDPNRTLVLFLGFLTALGSAGVVVIARATGQRRTPRRSMPSIPAPRARSVAPGSHSSPPEDRPVPAEKHSVPPGAPSASPEPRSPKPPSLQLVLAAENELGQADPRGPNEPALAGTQRVEPERAPVLGKQSSSILPQAVIEVSRTAPEKNDGELRVRAVAGTERTTDARVTDARVVELGATVRDEHAPKPARPPTRVTQVLGSPVVPVIPASKRENHQVASAVVTPTPANAKDGPSTVRGVAPPTAHGNAAVGAEPALAFSVTEPVVRPSLQEQTLPSAEANPAPSPAASEQGAPQRPAEPDLSAEARARRVTVYDISKAFEPDPALRPDARRELREQVLQSARGHCFVVGLCAGTESTEQKSRLAAELALALASLGRGRVLLMEGDFQRPGVHRWIRATPPLATGLSQQLYQRSRSQNPGSWLVLRCSAHLDALAEGVLRSPGLMVSHRFDKCVGDLRGIYDFIVIDGPPLSMQSECRVIAAVTDGMFYVAAGARDPLLQPVDALFGEKVFSQVVSTRLL